MMGNSTRTDLSLGRPGLLGVLIVRAVLGVLPVAVRAVLALRPLVVVATRLLWEIKR